MCQSRDKNTIIFIMIEFKLDDLIWMHRTTAEEVHKATGISNFQQRFQICEPEKIKMLASTL